MTLFALVTVIHDSADDMERLLASVERFLDARPRVVAADSGSRPTPLGRAATLSCGTSIQPGGLWHSCSSSRARRSPICRDRL